MTTSLETRSAYPCDLISEHLQQNKGSSLTLSSRSHGGRGPMCPHFDVSPSQSKLSTVQAQVAEGNLSEVRAEAHTNQEAHCFEEVLTCAYTKSLSTLSKSETIQ